MQNYPITKIRKEKKIHAINITLESNKYNAVLYITDK
jgi:hypothetical protein